MITNPKSATERYPGQHIHCLRKRLDESMTMETEIMNNGSSGRMSSGRMPRQSPLLIEQHPNITGWLLNDSRP